MLLHARVELPDRPGALAALTQGLAGNGADIVNISVLDSVGGRVVDDVYVTCPAGSSRALFLAVAGLPSVDIVGLRVAERPPGPLADLSLLEQLLVEGTDVLGVVVDALPHVLGADWAAASRGGGCIAASLGAPPEEGERRAQPRAVPEPYRTARVTAPLGDSDVTMTVGRDEDFPFHRTEVAHLCRLLAVVAAMLASTPADSSAVGVVA